MQRLGRMKHELSILKTSTMTGISVWNVEDDLFHLQAQIVGGDDSPYKGGVFKLEIRVPDRYPFEPPHVKFLTPIYHPNIDAGGRICLDVLKMPPKGNWKPSSNISTVLLSIQLLMNEPNPDDPLMEDISQQYKSDRRLFRETAARWTQRHAVESKASPKTTATTANDDGVEVSTGKVAGRVTPVDGKSSNNRAKAGDRTDEGKRDEGKISATSTTDAMTNSGRDEACVKTSNTSNDLKENRHPVERKNPATSSKSNVKSTSKSSDVDKHSASASSSVKRDSDDFDDMFEDDEDDDFIAKTPHKKTKSTTTSKTTSAVESDSFSDMNDSDLDLFDFDESPVKKKKKLTE